MWCWTYDALCNWSSITLERDGDGTYTDGYGANLRVSAHWDAM